MDSAVAGSRIGSVGRVAQAVLASQFFLNLVKNLVEFVFAANVERNTAGGFRDSLKRFRAVQAVAVNVRWWSRATAPPSVAAAVVCIGIGEADTIDQRIGELGCFDRAAEADLAADVDAIGEQDERLAADLLSS